MKKSLLLLFLSIFFAACETSQEDLELQRSADIYHFKDITYHLEENDFIKPVENWHKYIFYQNTTNTAVDAVFQPYQNEEDYSIFHGLENTSYTIFKEKPLLVNIPNNISKNTVFTGSEKHNLFAKENFPANRVSRTKETIQVKPSCGVKVEHNEVIELLHITYIATFEGEKYGNTITIKGTWEGKHHYGCQIANLNVFELQSPEL